MSNVKPTNPRTARTPEASEQKYVIVAGAPNNCYVDGYGLVGPGAIVSLAPGVDPGMWMVEVNPEDAAKASADDTEAQRLAVLAAAKIKVEGRDAQKERKRQADVIKNLNASTALQEQAQREADAIATAAAAAEKAQRATDELEAEKQRAADLQAQLDAANTALASSQTELEALKGAADKNGNKK